MKKLVANLLLIITTMVVSLCIIEFILRFFELAPGITIISLDNYSNREIVKGPEFTYYSEVNSLGLRELRNIDKHTKSKRIVFLGDSFVYGIGVSNHETFAYITEDLLNNITHNSWKIINVSQPGTGTFLQLNLLNDFLNKIDIEEVILFYYIENDPYDTMHEYNASKGQYLKFDKIDLIFNKMVEIKEWISKKIAIYRFLKLKLGTVGTLRAFPYKIFDQCDPSKVSLFTEMDELTRKLISDTKIYLQNKNIKFSVVLIPRQEQLSNGVFEKYKNQYGVSKINYDRFLPQKRLIANVFKPSGIKVFDLMDELNGKDPSIYYFPIDGHFNKRGNRFVAEIIASRIIDDSK
jgi:hypothetical protein